MPNNNASVALTQGQEKAPVLRERLGTGSGCGPDSEPHAAPSVSTRLRKSQLTLLSFQDSVTHLDVISMKLASLKNKALKGMAQNMLLNICQGMKQSMNLRTYNAHSP